MSRFKDFPRRAFSLIEVVLATAVFAVAIIAVVGLLAPGQRQVSEIQDSALATRLADMVRTELSAYPFQDVITSLRTGSANTRHVELVANRELTLVRSVAPTNLTLKMSKVVAGVLETGTYRIANYIPADSRLEGSTDSSKIPGSFPNRTGQTISRISGYSFSSSELAAAPGIANRDRYFFIRIEPIEALMDSDNSATALEKAASMPVRVTVFYPFQTPLSAATEGKAEARDESDGTLADPSTPNEFSEGKTMDLNGDDVARAELAKYLATKSRFTFNMTINR